MFFGLVGRPHILILGPMQWHSTVRGGKDSSEFVGRIKNCCNESADNKFCVNDTEQNVFLSCKYVWLVGSMRFWMEILILQFFPSAECSSVPRLDNFFNFWMNCFRSAPADDPAPGKMQHNFNSVQIYISSTPFTVSHQHLPDLLMNLEEVSSGWWSVGPIGQMVHWSLCGLGPTPTQHYPHHDHLTTWGSNNIWPAALSVRETVSSMVNWFSFGHQTNDWGKPLKLKLSCDSYIFICHIKKLDMSWNSPAWPGE